MPIGTENIPSQTDDSARFGKANHSIDQDNRITIVKKREQVQAAQSTIDDFDLMSARSGSEFVENLKASGIGRH